MPVHTFTVHREYHKSLLPFIGYILGYENYKNLSRVNLSTKDCPHAKGLFKFIRSTNEVLADCPIRCLIISLIAERNMFSISLVVNPYYLAKNDTFVNLFTEEYLEVLPEKFKEFLETLTIQPELKDMGYYSDFLDFYKWKVGELHATYDFRPVVPPSYMLKLLYRSFRPYRNEQIRAISNEDDGRYNYITIKNKSLRVSFYDKERQCINSCRPTNVIQSAQGILRFEVQLFSDKTSKLWNDFSKNNRRFREDNRKRTDYLLSDEFTDYILVSYYEKYFPKKPWHSLDRSKSIIDKAKVSKPIKELSAEFMKLIRLHDGTQNAINHYSNKKPFLKVYDDIQNKIGIAPYSIPCRDYATLGIKNTPTKCISSPYSTLKNTSGNRLTSRDSA